MEADADPQTYFVEGRFWPQRRHIRGEAGRAGAAQPPGQKERDRHGPDV